jgi:hypothetical protein
VGADRTYYFGQVVGERLVIVDDEDLARVFLSR